MHACCTRASLQLARPLHRAREAKRQRRDTNTTTQNSSDWRECLCDEQFLVPVTCRGPSQVMTLSTSLSHLTRTKCTTGVASQQIAETDATLPFRMFCFADRRNSRSVKQTMLGADAQFATVR